MLPSMAHRERSQGKNILTRWLVVAHTRVRGYYDAPVGPPASLVLHITPSLILNPHFQPPSVKWCPHHRGEGQVVSLVGAEICWKCVSKHHRYDLTALTYIVVVCEAPEPERKQR